MPELPQDISDEEQLTLLWDALLSHDPPKIHKAFSSLDKNEQQAVLDHLNEMVTGEGWQPVQRQSAKAALQAIQIHP